MTATNAIEVALDLRAFTDRPTPAQDVLDFWDRLQPALLGAPLRVGESRALEPEAGRTVGVRVLAVPDGLSTVGPDTPFAVYGLAETPTIRHACRECRPPSAPRYGPYSCIACSAPSPLCDDHVVILDGRLNDADGRLLAFCPAHRPAGADGKPATFWCAGAACRRAGKAWAEGRVKHPSAAATWYCPTCYADEFPKCGALGCQAIGSNRCEFIDPTTGDPCGQRRCNLHVRRWQVYGPHEDGLRLCGGHPSPTRLSAAEVVFQVTAATADRRLTRRTGGRVALPSLSYLRYTLQKATGRMHRPTDIHGLFQQVSVPRTDLQRSITDLRGGRAGLWERELAKYAETQATGERFLDQAKAEFRRRGLGDVADRLVLSEYIGGANGWLFVHLPATHVPRFLSANRAVAAALKLTKLEIDRLK